MNARVSLDVLLLYIWNNIDVIKKLYLCSFGWYKCNFLIKKIISMPLQMYTRRTLRDVLVFLKSLRTKSTRLIDLIVVHPM
jgi:hypothetical protein